MSVEPSHNSESLIVHFRRIESLKEEAKNYPSVQLYADQLYELELLLTRGYFPLDGYMTRAQYESVLDKGRLPDGTLWPLPVVLAVAEKDGAKLKPGTKAAIRDEEGVMLAVLHVADNWKPNLKREAEICAGKDNLAAHGALNILGREGQVYLGGRLEGVQLPLHYDFTELRFTPDSSHRYAAQRGWTRRIGVLADRPLHKADAQALQALAKEHGAAIFLSPALKPASPLETAHFSLVRCQRMIMGLLPRRLSMFGVLPFYPSLHSPREAVMQALILRNYGCTHTVPGLWPDPGADIAESKAFAEVRNLGAELNIEAVAPTWEKDAAALYVAPDALREKIEKGQPVDDSFTFPEVINELAKTYPPRKRQGLTLFFTGLSGAGKSTIAKLIYVKLQEIHDRPVTLLDGDIVRRNLSSELNFSKEHRNLNVTRIGFVASEITKNGGIAICAPIAPYDESRRANRELISRYGGYVEIYVSTPLEVCEQRDRKGLYAKARAGIAKGVTGVDDPYEEPQNPSLRIDTTELTPLEAVEVVVDYLKTEGYM